MNFYTKFRIFLAREDTKYNEFADIVLTEIMNNGRYYGFRLIYHNIIYFKYKNTIGSINIDRKSYGNDFTVLYCDRNFNYSKIRPSKLMKIKFWEWLEKQNCIMLEFKLFMLPAKNSLNYSNYLYDKFCEKHKINFYDTYFYEDKL